MILRVARGLADGPMPVLPLFPVCRWRPLALLFAVDVFQPKEPGGRRGGRECRLRESDLENSFQPEMARADRVRHQHADRRSAFTGRGHRGQSSTADSGWRIHGKVRVRESFAQFRPADKKPEAKAAEAQNCRAPRAIVAAGRLCCAAAAAVRIVRQQLLCQQQLVSWRA